MAKQIKLAPSELKPIRTVDERLVSYNVEMTEVTAVRSGKLTPRDRSQEQSHSTYLTYPLVTLLRWQI